MIRHIVVNTHPVRMETIRRFLPDAEVFEGSGGCNETNYRTVCIPKTYQRLAVYAVKRKWGRETVVMQDDVWLPHGEGFEAWNDEMDWELVVFGIRESGGLVCPKAFSASPKIWLELKKVWDGKGRICPAWQPVVTKHALVLSVTRELGRSAPSAPCRGCGKH